jgi:hypothetical protein
VFRGSIYLFLSDDLISFSSVMRVSSALFLFRVMLVVLCVLAHLVPQCNTSSVFHGMVLEPHANTGLYLLPSKSAVLAHLRQQCKIW